MSLETKNNDEPDEKFTSAFAHLYKTNGQTTSELSQQERREFLLKEQKEKRHSLVDRQRDLSELFSEEEDEVPVEDMEVDPQQKPKKKDKFFLMFSEWFTDVPIDLEDNWLVKLAPEGFRVLVIAKKFRTVVLNERGKVLTLKTHFPGGGLNKHHGLTVLDCIYNKSTQTIFVLDCLFWNTMSMLDSETTFRFYWLETQFNENSKLLQTSKPHKFQLIKFFPAEKSLIQQKVFEKSTSVLDTGIVFYHKELHYVFGQTPLLGWLYTYMLPEKLGIDVPEELLNKMPKDYKCLEQYLVTLEKRQELKRKSYKERRQAKSNLMET
ncbi:unnamed protein product [Ceutorhynchus assimilis]|uniref:Snurportin-1 n=1 Tax=Ceutorhynchus assimilis TaxID=467358 RepID=A0A9N9MER7_9CUCU|nr:unnamed protein product [Ceutorhynchus assimilis]